MNKFDEYCIFAFEAVMYFCVFLLVISTVRCFLI